MGSAFSFAKEVFFTSSIIAFDGVHFLQNGGRIQLQCPDGSIHQFYPLFFETIKNEEKVNLNDLISQKLISWVCDYREQNHSNIFANISVEKFRSLAGNFWRSIFAHVLQVPQVDLNAENCMSSIAMISSDDFCDWVNRNGFSFQETPIETMADEFYQSFLSYPFNEYFPNIVRVYQE